MRKTGLILIVLIIAMGWTNTVVADWNITRPDSQGSAGKYTALALDSEGHPHIAYQETTTRRLKYAYHTGTAWVFEYPPDTNEMGFEISMALDSSDLAHICHLDNAVTRGMYTSNSSTGIWDTYTMVYADGEGTNSSICVDELDRIFFAYASFNETDLKVAIYDKPFGDWLHYNVATGNITTTSVQCTNMDILPIHVAFADYDTETLKCIKSAAPQWITETVAYNVYVAVCQLQLDENDYEHIMFIEGDTGELRYARNSPSGWSVQTLFDHASPTLRSLSYARTQDGIHRVCYQDLSNHLVYASNESGSWKRETVDQSGNTGLYCSIAIGDDELARISYYDATLSDLKYAVQIPAADTDTDGGRRHL